MIPLPYCRYCPDDVPLLLRHFDGHNDPILFRRLIRQAQITPVAASMKLHKLAGADSNVGSLAWRLWGSVAMRSAVVKQMKKPMEKSTTRPIFEPIDMLSRRMTGIGRMKIAMSVIRFRIAFDQLV
jgi:hypothetical protein